MAFNFGAFFSSGVKEIGEGFKAKDVSVKAEAKASAEAFAKAQESYENEITGNRNILKKNAKSLQALGINDVGKIRTIISAYGGTDTLSELQKDFTSYQSDAILGQNNGQFKTLKEYVNGKISGTGNTFVSDEAAEQAQDEAAIAGDELDIQQAEKKAKAQGISLEKYLDNQARAMSDRPAFSIKAKAARLVEESSMGLFGKTLTMEEAIQKITGGQTIGKDAEDLGDSGYTMDRESDLSAKDKIALKGIARTEKERVTVTNTELDALEKSIEKSLVGTDGITISKSKDGLDIISKNSKTKQFIIAKIKEKLDFANKQEPKDLKGIRTLSALLDRVSGPQPEANQTEVKSIGMDKAIEILKQNPKPRRIQQFISSYGKENLPAGLENKTENKKDNIIKTDKTRQIDSEGNAPPKPPSSFLTKPKEKAAREEWDKLYGNDFYPNGRPKPKKK
jgi:hypothetical protein